MMNVVRSGHRFLHRGRLYPPRPDVSHKSAMKPLPADGDALAKKTIVRPIPARGRRTKAWTTIAWPTNIQSRTPDGKFGPAKQMKGWNDCWFLASLAAVANDEDGHKILSESIKQVNGGYDVTFKGLPENNVFISDAELQQLLETEGGDADTRLMQLAADNFFKERGHFKSLYIAHLMKGRWNQDQAEQCFQDLQNSAVILDPMTYNPMRGGSPKTMGFFMFTGMFPDYIDIESNTTLQTSDVMAFLNKYITNDRDGASVAITGDKNPLGDFRDACILVTLWDVIRTEITSNGTMSPQQRAFLNTLNKWLGTGDLNDLEALASAAGHLKLEHDDPVEFVNKLTKNRFKMSQDHINLLRSDVQEVLAGGPGFIGFPGSHCGTIEGINAATNTFTYSEPNHPTLVHTGELSGLVQDIKSGNVYLAAVEPTTEREDRELFEHAGQKRARHLKELHHQVARDGKINPSESGPLANLIEMDDGAFWQVYDSDKNSAIEGSELKSVQLRVDRWVDHFKLTPIW